MKTAPADGSTDFDFAALCQCKRRLRNGMNNAEQKITAWNVPSQSLWLRNFIVFSFHRSSLRRGRARAEQFLWKLNLKTLGKASNDLGN